MIRTHYLRRPSHLLTISSVDLSNPPRSNHKFYSIFARTTLRQELGRNSFIRPPKPWRSKQSSLQRLSGSPTPRFASTTPTSPPHTEVQSDHVSPPETATPAEGEIIPASFDEVMGSVSPPVYEHLGFLKELGLDYGWGTTAFVQTVLEHVHIYLGTPWWASIGITVVLIRASLFKFFVDAADSNARRQIIKPLEEPLTERMKVAQAEKNRMALQEIWRERSALHRSAGIIWWKSFLPFLQLPLGFGIFRLMRGMAYLPVPGLDTGGFLWVHDLTVSDPYYILPLIASWAYYYAFKKGGEAGSNQNMSPRTRQVFLYVIPFGGGLFMLAWPAGLQLTFGITSLLAALQATLFKNDWVRNFLGMQPLRQPAAPTSQLQLPPRYQAQSSSQSEPETKPGVMGNVKGAVADIMKAGEKYAPVSKQVAQKGRLTEAEKRRAEQYEKSRQKALAIDEKMTKESAKARVGRRQEEEIREREREERLQRRAAKKARGNW